MKFETPAGTNPIDAARIVGKPIDRVDGPIKVAGRAPYAYEVHDEVPNAAYGYMLGAAIAKGKITRIDTAAAERAPGVLAVLTHRNAEKQPDEPGDSAPQLQGPEIRYYDQAVALVVAETFEQARAASRLILVDYDRAPGVYDLAKAKSSATKPKSGAPDTAVGDFPGAFGDAAVKVDVTYTTPDHAHAMMEPHASIAKWDGDALTLWTSNQMIHWAVRDLAKTLAIPKDKVRVISPYIGGGFGSKLWIRADAVLAAMGAKAAGRPVKVALTRPQIFNNTTHRPATIQRLRIGARRDGTITAIGHEVWNGNLPGGDLETAANQTRLLYAGANRMTAHRLAVLDLPEGNAMRAPGEAVGLLALECAMDELAEKLAMDPVALRIKNDTQFDPEAGPKRPFSTRQLVECLETGAQRFGWSRRSAKPAQTRDGQWLIGMGVASAFRDNLVMKSGARVRLDGKGRLIVETQMTDIGTGSYTILTQVAAETMGLPIEAVTVRLGDSDFPVSAGSGGQWGANSSAAGVYAACMALRVKVAQKAGFNTADVLFEEGRVTSGNRSITLAEATGPDDLMAEDMMEYGDLQKRFAHAAFGAHFAEVGVDRWTGEVRVRRMLSVCAAGRILNPKTARNQCLGGMTMGIGAALMEEQVVDTRFGYFVNHDLAEYQVPVHADIPDMEVIFLDELDDKSSPIKAKGVGELGICGVGAAVANAVYNATGVRIRDYPLTLDKILPHLPAIA